MCRSNSLASVWEATEDPVLNPTVKGRERSVTLPWPALKHHLDLVGQVGGTAGRYYGLAYRSGRYYTNDMGEPGEFRSKAGEGWEAFKPAA